jgi:hypothetical protein
MIRAVYFHAIDGRIRIFIPKVKGSHVAAVEIADRLRGCRGIDNVSANPVTGNVLITYDSNRTTQWDVLDSLREMGFLGGREYIAQNTVAKAEVNSEWGAALARIGLEALLSALIL